MKNLIFECSIDICKKPVMVKIFHEKADEFINENYSFELSHYFKASDDIDIYIPSCHAESLEHCIYILNQYKNRFNDIEKEETNKLF